MSSSRVNQLSSDGCFSVPKHDDYLCILYNNVGIQVANFSFELADDWRGFCRIPDDIDYELYGSDDDNNEGHDPAGICPLVPPQQKVTLALVLQSTSEVLYSKDHDLARCCGSQNHCSNGGTCSRGGYCVCVPGWCGATCDVPSEFSACGGFTHPILSNFLAYVVTDWSGPTGSDVEGRLAAGGDVSIGSYSVGELETLPSGKWNFLKDGREQTFRNDLAVGKILNFSSGAILGGGNAIASEILLTQQASVNPPGQFLQTKTSNIAQEDFHGATQAIRKLSRRLASLPRTGTTVMKYTTMQLVGTRKDVNIFHVSLDDLLFAREIELDLTTLGTTVGLSPFERGNPDPFRGFIDHEAPWDPDSTPTTIINILWQSAYTGYGDGNGDPHVARKNGTWPSLATEARLSSLGMTGHFNHPNASFSIIWNFPFATRVNVSFIEVRGSLLAPAAFVDFPSGQIRGQILARSFRGNGQINLPVFRGNCRPDFICHLLALNGGELDIEWKGVSDVRFNPDSPLAYQNGSCGISNSSFSRPTDLVGKFGQQIVPVCRPFGELNRNMTCDCWDPTFRRGPQCETLCIDYCNGRGMCNARDVDTCDCFDPLRWFGSRCQISRCGAHGWVDEDDPFDENGDVRCNCMPGWSGDQCGNTINCVNGKIVQTSCLCYPGWSGDDCSVNQPQLIQCDHGTIEQKEIDDVPTYVCRCSSGWSGSSCNKFQGDVDKKCYYGIFNSTTGTCSCLPFWSGSSCDTFTCIHGRIVDVPFTGGIYGSTRTLQEAVRLGDDSLSDLLPVEDSAVIPYSDNRHQILRDRDPLQLCQCDDNWFGVNCDRHCNATCNWRGTKCSDLMTLSGPEPLPKCECNSPWEGDACTQQSVSVLSCNDVNDDNMVEMEWTSVYGSSDPDSPNSEMHIKLVTQAKVCNDIDIRTESGQSNEMEEICDLILSRFGIENGTARFDPVKACLPFKLWLNTNGSTTGEATITMTFPSVLTEFTKGEEDQFLYYALFAHRLLEEPSITGTTGIPHRINREDYDEEAGTLTVSVHIPDGYCLVLMQPTREERLGLLSSSSIIGDDALSDGALAGIVIGVLVVVCCFFFMFFGKRLRKKSSFRRDGEYKAAATGNGASGDDEVTMFSDDPFENWEAA